MSNEEENRPCSVTVAESTNKDVQCSKTNFQNLNMWEENVAMHMHFLSYQK
jgi:hypothetical protein